MRNYDWLLFLILTIIYGQHIHLSLINSELAEIHIEEKDISALHTRIEQLRYFKRILFLSTHNGCTFLYSSNRILASNIHHSHPILVRSFIYLLWCPNEFHIMEFHACCLPNLYKILSYCSDFLKISIVLAIKHSEIVSDPKDKNTACINHFIDIDSSE